MNYGWKPRRLVAALIALPVLALLACDQIALSPRQQLVRDATRAMCAARDLKAMLPFVTERSRPTLELAASMAELGSIFKGEKLADRIAIQCADGALEFVDEVQLSDQRFVVRTRSKGSAEVSEAVVMMEAGQWKIAFSGK